MGWAHGSRLANELWNFIRPHISPEDFCHCAQEILRLFKEEDADDFYPDDQLIIDAGEADK